MSRETYEEGDRVAIAGYGYEVNATVKDKTRGDATKVTADSDGGSDIAGRTMLISNKALRRL